MRSKNLYTNLKLQYNLWDLIDKGTSIISDFTLLISLCHVFGVKLSMLTTEWSCFDQTYEKLINNSEHAELLRYVWQPYANFLSAYSNPRCREGTKGTDYSRIFVLCLPQIR